MTLRALVFALLLAGCAATDSDDAHDPAPRSFAGDLALLERHTDVVVLGDEGGPRVVVCPEYQGRVMTSTVGGSDGRSQGWVNRELVRSGRLRPQINAFGGEDRFWLGPEGGPFSIFFEPGSPQELEHWQTPPPIDSEPWSVVSRSPRQVALRHRALFTNRRGTVFDVSMDRTVRLLDAASVPRMLGFPPGGGVRYVAFESENRITNVGPDPWRPATGLLSIWILGMFPPGPSATVVIPVREAGDSDRGAVRDDYFGEVPRDRLRVAAEAVYFKADGRRRSKIGIPPERAKGLLASFDPEQGVLTVVQYNQPEGVRRYVDSRWTEQEDPYAGDAIHSYNDGPPAPGRPPLGPFYELESSSPAAALAPGGSIVHLHRTFHFEGDRRELDALSRRLLGVGLEDIEGALYRQ